jgi:hypothetical protein
VLPSCSGATWQQQQQDLPSVVGFCDQKCNTAGFTVVQAVSAKDPLIAQLQQQLEQQASSIAASAGDHENNVAKLIKSINEMQQSCQAQV